MHRHVGETRRATQSCRSRRPSMSRMPPFHRPPPPTRRRSPQDRPHDRGAGAARPRNSLQTSTLWRSPPFVRPSLYENTPQVAWSSISPVMSWRFPCINRDGCRSVRAHRASGRVQMTWRGKWTRRLLSLAACLALVVAGCGDDPAERTGQGVGSIRVALFPGGSTLPAHVAITKGICERNGSRSSSQRARIYRCSWPHSPKVSTTSR